MLNDLMADLNALALISANDKDQIDEVLKLAIACKQKTHSVLKFYGD